MLKIYHVPRTRSVRPIWLCYELELPVDVEFIDFSPKFRHSPEWRAISPAGKVPAMVDGDLAMFESGAMVDYILERYGKGRLQPTLGTPESAAYRQWCWFAEATLVRPLGLIRLLRAREESIGGLIDEAEAKCRDSLSAVESALSDRPYLLGDEFTAADIMMGYSVAMAQPLLGDQSPNLQAYLARLMSREAYQRVAALKN